MQISLYCADLTSVRFPGPNINVRHESLPQATLGSDMFSDMINETLYQKTKSLHFSSSVKGLDNLTLHNQTYQQELKFSK